MFQIRLSQSTQLKVCVDSTHVELKSNDCDTQINAAKNNFLPTGSHCLDILPATKEDPIWLVKQRNTEVEIIRKWIATYHADLRAFGKY